MIAHHYFDIDESIVYDVVKNKLPGMLETEVSQVLPHTP
ncbi:MAG: DUF86 domain-containing protein [Prevotella sp.]|nr:DUF86 domain-containing protein [Prevotella sp.]